MCDNEHTDTSSNSVEHKNNENNREAENVKNKSYEVASKTKRTRKSMAPRMNTEIKEVRQENNESSIKQIKLTQLWKVSTALSESNPKNMSNNEAFRKKLEQQLEEKNKLLVKVKNERDAFQKKANLAENQNKLFRHKTKDVVTKLLLQITQAKRAQRSTINPSYGYFKDSTMKTFVEGPFLNQIHKEIRLKMERIEHIKAQYFYSDIRDKETQQFVERFYQKEIDELRQQLKRREKIVKIYRQKIVFSNTEAQSYYAKLGWPAIGENERFQILQLLGSGGFGSVYKCYDFVTCSFVALKQNRFNSGADHKNNEEQKQNYLKHMQRQVKIQKNLNHPNIAKLIQVLKIDENEVSFVMQYLEGPELGKYLKQNTCLPESQAKQIIKQLICGLKYLYEQDNKIIHYDLKPSNIMFNRGIVKIVDFGLCKQMESDDTRIGLTSYGVGTYYYLPPETFMEDKAEVSTKVDIWSVGVIFYQLLYGKKPFGHGINQSKIYSEGIILKATKVDFPSQTPLKYKVSEGAKQFIKDCLKYQQEQRLSPIQAYEHSYFK